MIGIRIQLRLVFQTREVAASQLANALDREVGRDLHSTFVDFGFI